MRTELCDLFKSKQSEAARAYTICRLMKLMPGEDANLHLCKMFRSSIRYGADLSLYTPNKVCELIRAAAARQIDFRIKRGGKRDRGEHKSEGGKGDQGKLGHPAKSKEKSRACYVCGNEDHINVNYPEKAKKLNGAENSDSKREPRSNCTIRRDNDVQPELSDEDPGVATGMMIHGLTGVKVNEQPVNGLIAEVPEGAEVAGITGLERHVIKYQKDVLMTVWLMVRLQSV
ncbi:LOW QUALITY PROTEIN: Multidrug resistance protein ABC Superfamily [Phytophthora palmivora]|uniref:Multidrug resistance protein ABC Superfamily n=1 Tax=Phytophthora palmivora TaxID=4796 RepID=A0A2P4Y9J3_9STRA|nr:LOW QUALITY PROTEIN: Multidrug resistance protein ABC Superfamily [Phytophthora palmivora]